MGSLSTSVKSLAAGGGLIALASIAGCGSSNGARENNALPGSAPAQTATASSVPLKVNAAMAGAPAQPTPPVPDASKVAGGTLCETGETPLFSCEIGSKLVSVCSGGPGAVYRYGAPSKVELTSRTVTFASRGFSGGGESQITAKNDDYTYTVYDRTVRSSFDDGGNDPNFSSGLVIARGGRVISSKMCSGEPTVEAGAERALSEGRFVEH